jgi:hypothetical protein
MAKPSDPAPVSNDVTEARTATKFPIEHPFLDTRKWRLSAKPARRRECCGWQVCCLIDFCIALHFSRSPMVVFEVIGRLMQRFVRVFMIAAERNRWMSLSPKRGLTLYKPDEIVLGMAEQEEKRRV